MQIYDPFSFEIQNNPYPAYKMLRDKYPAYFVEQHNLWVISRYADCLKAAQDHASFSSASGNTNETL